MTGGERSIDDYIATQDAMCRSGVPQEYVDALLDDDYMMSLINATDLMTQKRKDGLQRYLRLNRIILALLIMQAVLGVTVALYKTVLQPDYLFRAFTTLENIDMVLALDAAAHMQSRQLEQSAAIQNFTQQLNTSMDLKRDVCRLQVQDQVDKLEDEQVGFLLKYFPFLGSVSSGKASVHGGLLQVSTGLFNAVDTLHLHGFTGDLAVQSAAFDTVQPSNYQASAQWSNAMKYCDTTFRNALEAGKPLGQRYCAILADDEAMCQIHKVEQVDMACKYYGMCNDDLDKIGNMLEFPEEMDYCRNYASDVLREELDVNMIVMFVVGSEEEKQLRLSFLSFRSFIEETTGCDIIQTTKDKVRSDGLVEQVLEYELNESTCLFFIIAKDLEELVEKTQVLASRLKATPKVTQQVNDFKEYKYLFFLLLPLNLLFYVLWSKIVKFADNLNKQVKVATGQKKKMVKVTKKYCEKALPGGDVELEAPGQARNIEMAAMSAKRPPAQLGTPLTLRARLKGGYLRINEELDECDGNGRAYNPESYWKFEMADLEDHADTGGCALEAGRRVRIRTTAGEVLRVCEDTGITAFCPGYERDPRAKGPRETGDLRKDSSLDLGGDGNDREKGPRDGGNFARNNTLDFGGNGDREKGPRTGGNFARENSLDLGGNGDREKGPRTGGNFARENSLDLGGNGDREKGPRNGGNLTRDSSLDLGGNGDREKGPRSGGNFARESGLDLGGNGDREKGPRSGGNFARESGLDLGGNGDREKGPRNGGDFTREGGLGFGGNGDREKGPRSGGNFARESDLDLGGRGGREKGPRETGNSTKDSSLHFGGKDSRSKGPREGGQFAREGDAFNINNRKKGDRSGGYTDRELDELGLRKRTDFGEDTEFIVEFSDQDPQQDGLCRLGTTIRLQSVVTGKYLNIKRDGTCDALSDEDAKENLFAVDHGGKPIVSGSLITTRSHQTGHFVHSTPQLKLSALAGGDKWRHWMIEKKTDDEVSGVATPEGPVALKKGDTVTLRSINQQFLEMDQWGNSRCGVSQNSCTTIEEDSCSEPPIFDSEFIIDRVGVKGLRRCDHAIRHGMTISLKPKRSKLPDNETDHHLVCVDEDGKVTGKGSQESQGTSFTIEIAEMHDMSASVSKALVDGDVSLSLQDPNNKTALTKVSALAADWCTPEDLAQMKGSIVNPDEEGNYDPKDREKGWIAVVSDKIDVVKATKSAKSKGASGLLVKCTSNLSLDRVKRAPDDGEPELPAVFVGPKAGEAVAGPNLILTGCEFKGTKLAKALRHVKNISDDAKGAKDANFAFTVMGAALEQEEIMGESGAQEVQVEEIEEPKKEDFKWKISANAQYIWSSGSGGARAVNVNFGAKPPPAATVKRKSGKKKNVATTVAMRESSTAIIPSEEFQQKQLASELADMLISEDAVDELEQLPEDSDFKIEYKFEEVEVAEGETPADMEGEQLLDDEGTAVGHFAVPESRFWIVATGMIASTLLLGFLLVYTMLCKSTLPKDDGDFEAMIVPLVKHVHSGFLVASNLLTM